MKAKNTVISSIKTIIVHWKLSSLMMLFSILAIPVMAELPPGLNPALVNACKSDPNTLRRCEANPQGLTALNSNPAAPMMLKNPSMLKMFLPNEPKGGAVKTKVNASSLPPALVKACNHSDYAKEQCELNPGKLKDIAKRDDYMRYIKQDPDQLTAMLPQNPVKEDPNVKVK